MPERKAFPLRVDAALWTEIERLAAQELRSVNAQVEYLLREALAQRGRLPQEGGYEAPRRGRPPKRP